MFKNNAQAANRGLGIPLNSSQSAQCIPIIIGRTLTTPRVIWRGTLIPADGGKKGKKLNKKGGTQITSYIADIDMLLGTMGFGRQRSNSVTVQPLQSVLKIWSNKNRYDVIFGSWTGNVSGGAVTITVPGGGVLIEVIAVTVVLPYSVTFNDFGGHGSQSFSGNYNKALWNADFFYYDPSSQSPLAGSTRTPYTFTQPASVAASTTISIDPALNGDQVTVYFAYVTSSDHLPLTKVNQTFEDLLGSSHAVAEPIVYEDVGGIAAVKTDVGVTGMTPNFKYETLGWGTSNPDADVNPADVISLLLMAPHGLNAASMLAQTSGPTTILGDYTALRNYCDVNGIWISCYFDQQTSGSGLLGDLFDTANAAPFWSEGVLKAVPWSEVSQVGNGAIYNAPTAAGPVVNISAVDFACEQGKAPITINRVDQRDSKNILPIEFTDRVNDYVVSSIDVSEGQSISEFGARRDSTKTYHWLMDAGKASVVGTPLIKRSALQQRTNIVFKLSPRFLYLEPMDLIAFTEPISGLTNYPVRPTKASFEEDGTMSFECDPYFYGVNSPFIATAQSASPNTIPTNVDPGVVGAVYFFEPIPRLITSGAAAELWIALAGSNSNYGGCEVLLSVDSGSSYNSLGRFAAISTMGITAGSTWPAANDPDTTNDLAVDLSASNGVLPSWPSSSADLFVPLAVVDGGAGVIPYEIIAYTTATLTSTSHYTLKATGAGNEIRRSVYSAPTVGAGVAHTVGKQFVYLNEPIFKIPLDPKWINKNLLFKFLAFNIYGTEEQSQAAVSPVSYTPTGVAAAVGGVAATTYTITPASPLSQAASTYSVVMAQSTAIFSPSGLHLNYNTRTFTVSDPGVSNTQQYWVTIQDPGLIGDTGSGTTLNAFCDTNQTRWNTVGFIRIGTIIVTHLGSVSGGGGGSSSGSALTTLVATDSGDHLTFTLNKTVTFLMLWRNGDFVDPNDYTFTGSGFILKRAVSVTDNINAVGA